MPKGLYVFFPSTTPSRTLSSMVACSNALFRLRSFSEIVRAGGLPSVDRADVRAAQQALKAAQSAHYLYCNPFYVEAEPVRTCSPLPFFSPTP